jgi:hypothetical protein
MKRLIVGLLLVCVMGFAAFAGGPLLNFGIAPAAGEYVSLGFGWNFDSWELVAQKDTFSTWAGDWSIAALWTPDVGFADLRVGPKLTLDWGTNGRLYYSDTSVILGVEKIWNIIGVFGDIEISAVNGLMPRVGVELHFDLPIVGSAVSNVDAVSNPKAMVIGK